VWNASATVTRFFSVLLLYSGGDIVYRCVKVLLTPVSFTHDEYADSISYTDFVMEIVEPL
jgi:hypothetical protein